MSDIMVGNGRFNYSAILRASNGVVFNPSNIPNGPFPGTPYIIVKHGDGDIRIMRWLGGGSGGSEGDDGRPQRPGDMRRFRPFTACGT